MTITFLAILNLHLLIVVTGGLWYIYNLQRIFRKHRNKHCLGQREQANPIHTSPTYRSVRDIPFNFYSSVAVQYSYNGFAKGPGSYIALDYHEREGVGVLLWLFIEIPPHFREARLTSLPWTRYHWAFPESSKSCLVRMRSRTNKTWIRSLLQLEIKTNNFSSF